MDPLVPPGSTTLFSEKKVSFDPDPAPGPATAKRTTTTPAGNISKTIVTPPLEGAGAGAGPAITSTPAPAFEGAPLEYPTQNFSGQFVPTPAPPGTTYPTYEAPMMGPAKPFSLPPLHNASGTDAAHVGPTQDPTVVPAGIGSLPASKPVVMPYSSTQLPIPESATPVAPPLQAHQAVPEFSSPAAGPASAITPTAKPVGASPAAAMTGAQSTGPAIPSPATAGAPTGKKPPLTTDAMTAGKKPAPLPEGEKEYQEMSNFYKRLAKDEDSGKEIAKLTPEDFSITFLGENSRTAEFLPRLQSDTETRENYLKCIENYAQHVAKTTYIDHQGKIITEAGHKATKEKLNHFAKTAESLSESLEKLPHFTKLQKQIDQVKPSENNTSLMQIMATRALSRKTARESGTDIKYLVAANAPAISLDPKDSLTKVDLTLDNLAQIKKDANKGFYDIGKIGGKNMAMRINNDAITLGFRNGENFSSCSDDDIAKNAIIAIKQRLEGKSASDINVTIRNTDASSALPRKKHSPSDEKVARRVAETRAGDAPIAPVKSSAIRRPPLAQSEDPKGVAPEVLSAAEEIAAPARTISDETPLPSPEKISQAAPLSRDTLLSNNVPETKLDIANWVSGVNPGPPSDNKGASR